MKIKSFIFSLLTVFVGTQALANQVVLENNSQNQKPFTIVYKFAYKNPGQNTVYGETVKDTVTDQKIIFVEPRPGLVLVGIVPTMINEHHLPPFQFDEPNQCSMATDAQHPIGTLTFTVDAHHVTCATKGGVIR